MKPLVVSKRENMDIEQNPGPSWSNHINLQENASVLLQGSIHQGDEIFSHDSRGRQCLPCCLAVQKRICTNMWNVNNMNEILFAGDKLYEYPFLDLETTLAMTFSFNPYAVFAWRTFDRVFKESLLFRKYNAQMLDIFHRAPSYGVVLVALECHLSSLHVLCLHRRYTALHQYFTI